MTDKPPLQIIEEAFHLCIKRWDPHYDPQEITEHHWYFKLQQALKAVEEIKAGVPDQLSEYLALDISAMVQTPDQANAIKLYKKSTEHLLKITGENK